MPQAATAAKIAAKPAQPASYSLAGNIGFVLKNVWAWDKALLLYALLFALATVVSPFATIFLPRQIINALSTQVRDLVQLLQTIFMIIMVLLMSNIGLTTAREQLRMRRVLYRNKFMALMENTTMTMDYAYIESPAGQTAREKANLALNSNASGGEAILLHSVNFVAHFVGLLAYSVLVGSLSPWIVLALIGGALFSIAATVWAQRYAASRKTEEAEIEKKRVYVQTRGSELAYAKDMRLFSMTGWFARLHNDHMEEAMSIRKTVESRLTLAESLEAVLTFARDLLAYGYLISLVVQGALSVGDFTLLFAAIGGISNWMSQLVTDFTGIYQASLDISNLRRYLDLPCIKAEGAKVLLPKAPYTIEFDRVTFYYPGSEAPILQDFSLNISAGEKLAIVGLNGAGKTTCVKLLTGLYRPTSGCIRINGIDTGQFDRDELFTLFGTIFQESRVLAVDVQENVAVTAPEEINKERVSQVLQLAGLEAKIASLPNGIATQLTRILWNEGVELSGGEAQKLMLARALYKDAPIVIMDEPTAALDPIAEAELYQQYNLMVGGKTSIYISHRLSSTRFCDRIALISEGRVAELGNHEELTALGGAYAKLFQVQSQYYQDEFGKEAVK